MPERLGEKELLNRVVEVASAMKLCNIVLSLSLDNTTLHFARIIKNYWIYEFSKLVPYITEQMVKTIEHTSEELAKTITRMLERS